MNKKQYLFPEVRIIEMNEMVIATSGDDNTGDGNGGNNEDPNAPARMNGTLLPSK